MFCSNCGAPLNQGAPFCPRCGASQSVASGAVRIGVPAPGFSARVNDPEILAAVKKNKKAAGLFTLFLVPLPLLGFVIYSFFSDQMELGQAALYGGIVSAVFLFFALYSFIKERAQKSYEAVVIDKKTARRYHHRNDETQNYYTEYITVARTAGGKRKKIVEHEGGMITAYRYLNVGDRFKFHPQFHFPYELYDKSKAPYIGCISCGAQNPVEADRCGRCNLPLLK